MPEETIGTAWLGDASGNKKYAHSVTSAVYDPVSGQTLDEVIGGITLEKLWENEAPTAEFAAQTVSLDLSQYELFLVTAMDKNSTDILYRELSFLAFKNVLSTMLSVFVGGYGPGTNIRPFQISENSINFSNAKKSYNTSKDTVSNDQLIPYRIYGVKANFL